MLGVNMAALDMAIEWKILILAGLMNVSLQCLHVAIL